MDLNIEAKIEKTAEKTKLSVPIAIILAGMIIAGAILVSAKIGGNESGQQNLAQNAAQNASATLDKMRKVSSADHIRGSLDAKVVVVEYSDTECPFCKQFHTTMKRIVEKYNGEVAWVYRHFPIDQLHSKARSESVALECAAKLGGNDKFWEYTDRIYEVTPANNKLDPAELPKIAEQIGLDVKVFNECLSSNQYTSKIDADIQNATDSGGRGTPWSIVVGKNDKKYPLSGAYPFELTVEVIEQALKGK